jgi:ComF family protein
MSWFFINHLLNLFFPKECFVCQTAMLDDFLLCYLCLTKQKVQPVMRMNLGNSLSIKIYSLFRYNQPFSKIVHSKFLSDQSLLKLSANIVPIIFADFIKNGLFKNSILIPIPIHWSRRLNRGFNQTEVFANQLSKLFFIQCSTILIRNKRTSFQSSLIPALRRKNLQNAFWINPSRAHEIENKKIILIDDLLTTGATLASAAKYLNQFNPSEIISIVICR